ncbi:hypothetical protein DT23_00295 [Thioclava indica]|uniref:Uncharacterized protein n=1 Tax=Thioclava indica TaxID=1353528 RepID=A0A074K0Z6_9RHOB|nr:hypothetical protein DT23_00295 [Thioclava indica]
MGIKTGASNWRRGRRFIMPAQCHAARAAQSDKAVYQTRKIFAIRVLTDRGGSD